MRPLLQALRPHQWTKNLLVFAALALSKHLFDPTPALRASLAFLLFCGLSGVVYLANDIADVARDRQHPVKKLRPVASGALPLSRAAWAALGLGTLCLLGSFGLGHAFFLCALAYLVLNLAYSFRLKQVVILDVISISIGFVLRAVGGGVAIGVQVSDWILICTILLALFLALAKRRHELTSLSEAHATGHRETLSEYSPYLLDQMISVVTASCVTAYAFYTMAPATVEKYQTERLAWTVPFVLYGIFRYLYLVHRKEQGGSPTDILLTDRPLLVNVALWALALVAIVYSSTGSPMPIGP